MRINSLHLPSLHIDLKKPLAKLGHEIADGFTHVKDAFEDGAAQAVGYTELLGIRYPVKKYQEQVSPELMRGSRLESSADYDALKAKGIKSVIDLTKEGTADEKFVQQKGMNLLRVPILDNGHPTMDQMKTFLDFMSKPENQPAYVHCEAGVGRTSIAVACYRMAIQGWSADKAIAEADKHGMKLPNQVNFLKDFDKALTAGQIPGYSR
ncbi:MAG: fused DSP-PTPase phosphatase/NAD kinase-like protein [Myxococcaceae bacterium]